ncbi:MAG: hypothetical protein GY804_11135 [Alphaproteobacteria bacterium]|nr:hypothetical protein [Alphaproteobacteria bacterium]
MDSRVIKFFIIIGIIGFGLYKLLAFTPFALNPFCIVDETRPSFLVKRCAYEYYDDCQYNKGPAQRCEVNAYVMAVRNGTAYYCALHSEGFDCIFKDRTSCVSAAKGVRGACVVNQKNQVYRAQMNRRR